MATQLDKLAMVRLDVSIWSARARLNATDLKDASNLPPSAMVSLGSKKLFDPTKLRVFNSLKQRANRLLDTYGTKFLGGWATDIDKLGEIEPQLSSIAQDFHLEVDTFFKMYNVGIDSWVAQFPEYEHVLRKAVPTLAQLKRKFSFDWQTFQISPVGDASYVHNNTRDAVRNLNMDAVTDVAKTIDEIYATSFMGKETVKKSAFRPFKNLTTKLQALSFVYPYFNDLNNLLTSIIEGYSNKCGDPQFVDTFKRLLASISTPDGLEQIIKPFAEGLQTADQTLFCAAPTEVVEPAKDDSLLDAAESVLAEPVQEPVQATVQEETFDSGGLW